MTPPVVAIVATYRPDPVETRSLVRSLLDQGVPVVVSDDASPCTADPLLHELAELGASVVRHEHNEGIARSLNVGLKHARDAGATWLLTVDQDSVLEPDYVQHILAAANAAESSLGTDAVGAVGAGSIDDASGELVYPVTFVNGSPTTHEVIQTGSLWNVAAMEEVGGFDERLAIDAVDAAACLRLRESGRHIVLATGLSVGHRVGDGRQVRFLGRSILVSGHSPTRRTSMVRNRLRLFPAEFAQSPVHALRTIRRVAVNTVLAVTIEDDRWAKARASARGLLPRRATGR
jgi:rhamnosyltransferase